MTTPDRNSTSTALLAIAAAFALGILLAKTIDWIGHGHPKQ